MVQIADDQFEPKLALPPSKLGNMIIKYKVEVFEHNPPLIGELHFYQVWLNLICTLNAYYPGSRKRCQILWPRFVIINHQEKYYRYTAVPASFVRTDASCLS